MKRTYIAGYVEEDQKYYAYAIPCTESDNLLSKLAVKGIRAANICDTKKRAIEIVTKWNYTFKINHVYMFDKEF